MIQFLSVLSNTSNPVTVKWFFVQTQTSCLKQQQQKIVEQVIAHNLWHQHETFDEDDHDQQTISDEE